MVGTSVERFGNCDDFLPSINCTLAFVLCDKGSLIYPKQKNVFINSFCFAWGESCFT